MSSPSPLHERPAAIPLAAAGNGWRLAGIAAILAGLLLAYLCLGPEGTSAGPASVLEALFRGPTGDRTTGSDIDLLVWELRLPRAICALLTGALLGCAGVALQGLLMNPLADPYTTGVSAGAAVGAAVAEALGLSAAAMGFASAALAFACALGSVALVYVVSRVGGRVSVQTFLLAGIVVGTFLWSAIPVLLALTGRGEELQRILFYLIGSLDGAEWTRAALLAILFLPAYAVLRSGTRELNLMSLGEESASTLGVDVERFKRRALAAASLATAGAVTVGGIIGFVGLVAPHAARRIVGPDHGRLLPAGAALGAALLLASDLIVRAWLGDLPVGVVTSLVGAPVFCLLLRRRRAAAW